MRSGAGGSHCRPPRAPVSRGLGAGRGPSLVLGPVDRGPSLLLGPAGFVLLGPAAYSCSASSKLAK